MTDAQTRLFRVHARHPGAPHTHVVTEVSFEAAAVAYLEAWACEATEDGTASVVVRDLASGHEHCFHLDLDTGAMAPCD